MRRRPKADAPSPSSAAANAEEVTAAPAANDSTPNPAAEPIVNLSAAANSETPDASGDAPKTPRRRAAPRRARTTDAEAAPEAPPAEAAPEPAPEPIASEAEPLPAKPKRTPRRRAAALADDAAVASAENAAVEAAANAAPVPAETETVPASEPPKRSRGRKRAEPKADAAAAPAEKAPAETAPEPVLPLLDVSPPAESVTEEAAAAPEETTTPPSRSSRRRSNRRASAAAFAAATAAEENAPDAEAVVVSSAAATNTPADEEAQPAASDADPAPVSETAAPSRRRGRQRRTPTTETPAAASAAEVPPPAQPDAPSPATPQRSRGRQRSGSPAAAAAPASTNATPDTAPVSAEPDTPRRVRGLPRRRETAAAAGETAAAAAPLVGRAAVGVPLAPVESLPPPYQALPADVLARLPDVRVQSQDNRPQLTVNGEARLPFWFFVNTQDEESLPIAVREIRMAYEAGIRFFTLLVHLPWKSRTGERRFGPLDDVLQMVAENAPDALFVPRLIFSPPTSWERANPNEMTRYANSDETGDVSLASRAFWEGEADEALRAAIEYIAQSEHAHRVAGFYLEHGEWLHEKERGADISEANTLGFRTWLKTKYKALVNLRAAWHDGSVTFENAAIPSENPQTASSTLFWSDRQQKWADFAQYTSETAASVIVRLAKSAKEASGNRSVVAVSYGYSLEIMRGNSGHLDLARVLASPHVDILTGPVSYSGRAPGGSAPLPVPLDSILLAGKLWISEDDTKTFLASGDTPDPYNPKIAAPEGAWAAHSRNFGAALARGVGISWMDLWGEGWLDDRYVWQNIAHLNDIAGRLSRLRQNDATDTTVDDGPDVAVFVDEKSFFDIPPASDGFLTRLVADQRDMLLRSGAKIGFYLLSDLLNPDFPQTPRLLLFLNAFHLPDNLKAAIKNQQDNGRTLAWLFGPGCRDETLGDVDTVGIQLKVQPWGSKTGTTVLSNVRSPLTENLRGQKLGDEVRTNPSYFVNDPKATVLGEYASGLPSLGYRKHGRWQSVFLGEPVLTLPLLRGLFRLAGVPVATVDDDVAVSGDNLLALHSAPGGGTTVFLQDDLVLLDLLTNETISSGGFGSRLSMPPQGSRLLFAGSPADVRALGGDPDAAPYGLSSDELPPAFPAFVFDAPPSATAATAPSAATAAAAPPPSAILAPPPFVRGRNRPNAAPATPAAAIEPASPEDADLMEAAFTFGEFSLADKEASDDTDDVENSATPENLPVAAAPSAADADAKKKRRRRRRGPNKTQDADEAVTSDADASEGADDETEGNLFTGEAENEREADANAADEGRSIASSPRADLPVPPGPPVRLTLEELLPQSTLTEETGDLPPIPDELLPLDTSTLPTSGEAEAANPSAETEAAEPPRKRRGRPRRTPTAAEAAPSENVTPPNTLELE